MKALWTVIAGAVALAAVRAIMDKAIGIAIPEEALQ
jgi:hypothetical protein